MDASSPKEVIDTFLQWLEIIPFVHSLPKFLLLGIIYPDYIEEIFIPLFGFIKIPEHLLASFIEAKQLKI